jgi:AcrR family transcriptional regulator
MHHYFQSRAIGANKRERTRQSLIDSAIDVFSTKGFEQARINEVTAQAGLANGTFYNHFNDKDDLAAAAADTIALEIATQLDSAMAGIERAATRVVVASTRFIAIAVENRAWGSVLVEQYVRAPMASGLATRYLKSDVSRGIEQGQFEVTLDDFLLEQIGALIIVSIRRQLAKGSNSAQSTHTCENILRLLGMTPARSRQEVAKAHAALRALTK